MINIITVKKWMQYLNTEYTNNKEMLTDLDSAIGDADHGINMARGFAAVAQEIEVQEFATLGELMKRISAILIKHVGGASGPLYGTLFMKMGSLPGKEASLDEFTSALSVSVDAVKKLGKSDEGDKSMLDVWCPVLRSLKSSVDKKEDLTTAFEAAVLAAKNGADATIPMVARKGRASFLGERSVGHKDPGAASSCIMIEQAAKAFT